MKATGRIFTSIVNEEKVIVCSLGDMVDVADKNGHVCGEVDKITESYLYLVDFWGDEVAKINLSDIISILITEE